MACRRLGRIHRSIRDEQFDNKRRRAFHGSLVNLFLINNNLLNFKTYASDLGRHPCNNYYDLIIRQEDLGEELGFLTKHLKLDLKKADPTKLFHSNSAKSDKIENYVKFYLDPIPIAIRAKLFNLFKDDLDIFMYGWNYTSNTIKF